MVGSRLRSRARCAHRGRCVRASRRARRRTRQWINLRGHPSAALVDWAEHRARELGGRILSGSWTTNEVVLNELRRRDFRSIRHSFRMSIDLDEDLPAPVPPDGMRVRTFSDGDEHAFYEAQLDSFADTWEPVDDALRGVDALGARHPVLRPRALVSASKRARMSPGFAICKVHPGDPELGWVQLLGVRQAWRGRGLGHALLLTAFEALRERGQRRAGLGVDAENPTGATRLYESVGMRVIARFEILREGHRMSSLRARCPNCRTFTAVAVGDGYECHSCGSTFSAGLVRVPAAWGAGGEGMADGARIPLPYPEVAVVEREHARRADRRGRGRATAAADRPRRVLLRARRRCVGRCATRRPARRRLDRRPRRSEHARDVSVGEPLGDAVPDAARRRRRRTPKTQRSSAPATSIRRRPSSSSRPGSTTRSTERSQASTRCTSRSTSTFSTRATSTCSSPSPTGRLPDEVDALLRDIAGRTTIAGNGRHRASRHRAERRPRGADARRGRLLGRTARLQPCLPGRVASTSRSRASARTSRPTARRIRTRARAAGRTTATTS